MAKAKKAKKAKTKAKKPAPRKATAKAKKAAKTPKQAPAAGKALAGAEAKVAALLEDYEDGSIDNAWDVIGDMHELDGQLSKTSSLRPAFDKMFGEIEDICRESAGG